MSTTESILPPADADKKLFGGWSVFCKSTTFLLCALYLVFFGFRGFVQLDLELKSPYPSFFKIYWADEGDVFTEQNMRQVRVKPGKSDYRVFLTHLGNVDRLRIDPLEYAGEIDIHGIRISQQGYLDLALDFASGFDALKPINEVERDLKEADQTGLSLIATGGDSQLEWDVETQSTSFVPVLHIVNLFLIIGLVAVLRKPSTLLLENDRFVTASLLVVLLLATAMATITRPYVHPDEGVHYQAVSYYSNHFLPPALDSAEVAHTYSPYGVTRLGNYEIYYQLAGHFSWLLQPFQLSGLINARLFGLFMLGFMLVYCMRTPAFRVFAMPTLISAQTWYLFSYANSDGFALFAAIIASFQAAVPQSALNRFLRDEKVDRYVWSLLALGGLIGVLLLTKSNFYFFLVFLGAYFLWRMACGEFQNQKRFWSRAASLCLVGLALYGVRIALDHAANGPDPSALRTEMAEQHATDLYNPRTPNEKKHLYLYMKDRGFSLERILQKEKWLGKIFLNGFGSYGFTQYFPSGAFFETVKNTGLLLGAFIILGVLITGPPRAHGLILIVLVCAAALISVLLWRSWAISFQAQGRYLAPVLPMLGILFFHVREYLNQKILVSLVVAMFLLGVYSFLFVGLHDIPKLDYFS